MSYRQDDEIVYYQPFTPGKVVLSRPVFYGLCFLSCVGLLAILTVIAVS